MNSFALLQEEVEDDGANITQQIPKLDEPQDLNEQVDRLRIDVTIPPIPPTAEPSLMNGTAEGSNNEGQTKAGGGEQGAGVEGDKENEKSTEEEEKTLSLEEYLAQKKALSSEVKGLSIRQGRRANDGQDGFKRMDKMKTKDERGEEGMTGIAFKKELHESKGLKDSTHATVARNAEIQKFFQRDPDDNRRQNSYRGRGRGGPRGGMGSRGPHYNSYDRVNSGSSYNNSNGSGNDQPGFHHSDSGGSGGYYNNRSRGGYERGGRGGGRFFDRGSRTGSYERGGRGGYRSNYNSNFSNSPNTTDPATAPQTGDNVASNTTAPLPNDIPDTTGNPMPATNLNPGDATSVEQSENFNSADAGFQSRDGGFQRGGRGGYRGSRGGFERGSGRFGSDRGGRGRGGYDRRGGYGGRGDGRGGRGGRGGYRGYDRSMPKTENVIVVPNVDDVSAFPAL